MLNLAVGDLDKYRAELADRGLSTGDVVTANKDGRLSSIEEPTATESPWSGISASSTEGRNR